MFCWRVSNTNLWKNPRRVARGLFIVADWLKKSFSGTLLREYSTPAAWSCQLWSSILYVFFYIQKSRFALSPRQCKTAFPRNVHEKNFLFFLWHIYYTAFPGSVLYFFKYNAVILLLFAKCFDILFRIVTWWKRHSFPTRSRSKPCLCILPHHADAAFRHIASSGIFHSPAYIIDKCPLSFSMYVPFYEHSNSYVLFIAGPVVPPLWLSLSVRFLPGSRRFYVKALHTTDGI